MSYPWVTAYRGELLREEPQPAVVGPCTCGHAKAAHEHYRPGSDCGACGPDTCRRFRRPSLLRRLKARIKEASCRS